MVDSFPVSPNRKSPELAHEPDTDEEPEKA